MEPQKEFKPFVPADKKMPELTITSVVTGILLAVLFGGANAYLGLRVGMTVSASIPAAVISMGMIRVILKKDSILENNIVQTIGSTGESVAAGAIFTMPVLFMWAQETGGETPSLVEISLISLIGGILGVLFMIPLRSALIVQEHGRLPYPEGKACAEVLLAGEKGGAKAGTVFAGLGFAAVYKFLADGLKLFPSEADWSVPGYKGAGIGIDVLPALVGVGYICGARVASYLLAGGVLGWFVLMPLIALFGGSQILYPAEVPIGELDAWGLWGSFIRYIGAGAVAAGGIFSLIKSMPVIIRTFRQTIMVYGKQTEKESSRLTKDISMRWVLFLIVGIMTLIWLIPAVPVGFFGAAAIILIGFFFATVSSRMVGLVGSSNNPVSGMAIATLLCASMILKAVGKSGMSGMVGAITIGSIICIIAAIAGDTSQDLKTGYIVGASPAKQQLGELIGVMAASLAIGGVLYLLSRAWGYGTSDLPAPQAVLMKMVVEGVMGDNLPWTFIICGGAIAVVAEILSIPVLPFAVGLYLPIHLSTPIMIGGFIRLYYEKRKMSSAKERKRKLENGTLYSSGMIAGEGLAGILLAVFAIIPIGDSTLGDLLSNQSGIRFGNMGSLFFFAVLCGGMLLFINRKEKI